MEAFFSLRSFAIKRRKSGRCLYRYMNASNRLAVRREFTDNEIQDVGQEQIPTEIVTSRPRCFSSLVFSLLLLRWKSLLNELHLERRAVFQYFQLSYWEVFFLLSARFVPTAKYPLYPLRHSSLPLSGFAKPGRF